MSVSTPDRYLRFQFRGKLADQSELNFYEAGRFYYGAARFIYTIEAYRQRRTILSRISSKIALDARIRTSEPGSFIQDVILASAPMIGESALKVPLEVFFGHVWGLLLPAGRSKQEALQIGQIFLEHTNASARQVSDIKSIVEAENATTQQALSILERVIAANERAVNRRLPMTPDEITSRIDDLRAEIEREKLRLPYAEQLASISAEDERKLSSQVRSSAQDMLLPLRNSASKLDIKLPANDNPIAKLDENTSSIIADEVQDKDATILIIKIKRFDRETGYGLARYDDLSGPIPFRVKADTPEWRDRVIKAMRKKEVSASFYIVRDRYHTPKLLVLDQLVDLPE